MLSDVELKFSINRPTTGAEILRCIQNLKTGQSCDIDMIVNEYMKNASDVLLNFILNYF